MLLVASAAAAQDPMPESRPTYDVELRCAERVQLTQAAASILYSRAVQLVSSAEFNSNSPSWSAPPTEVQAEYREALAGDYLRVAATTPLRMRLRSEPAVTVMQIIIRLNPHPPDWHSRYPDHFVDGVFTVDDKGDVIGYSLYRGVAQFRLFAAVSDIPDTTCRIPSRRTIQAVLASAKLQDPQ